MWLSAGYASLGKEQRCGGGDTHCNSVASGSYGAIGVVGSYGVGSCGAVRNGNGRGGSECYILTFACGGELYVFGLKVLEKMPMASLALKCCCRLVVLLYQSLR